MNWRCFRDSRKILPSRFSRSIRRLRTRRASLTNIRADLPLLVGRDLEMRELDDALVHYQLITMTGPGGVGKTALALQCARAASNGTNTACGSSILRRSPISRFIAATIANALDVPGSDDDDELSRLLAFLQPRTALLLIDNCEHLVEGVASVISRIRNVCAGVSILATSRELLHLEAEHVYRLRPLDGEASAHLFADRATALAPQFDPAANDAMIHKICEQLDGIPLAIELAAARVRALGVDELYDRLTERFRLLTSSTRTALPRHQTLAATIEWSYDLLPGDEQSLFRNLAVFRGSFSLQGAAAVCGNRARCDEFHVLDLLTSLADKSLLTVSLALNTRYRLLETIRQFASEKATEARATDVAREAHAGYFAAVASGAYREFDSQMPQGWLERLIPDIDNFRAALQWTLDERGDRRLGAQLAADCGPLFLRMELLGEGLQWCETRASRFFARAVDGRPARIRVIDVVQQLASISERARGGAASGRALPRVARPARFGSRAFAAGASVCPRSTL